LTELVNSEIDNLKEFIKNRSKGQLTGNATLEEELYDSQVCTNLIDDVAKNRYRDHEQLNTLCR